MENDVIFMSIRIYKRFMRMGKYWTDAFILYSHYSYTAILQRTKELEVNNIESLGWSSNRLSKAKAILEKMKLIKYIKRTNSKTGETDVYIKLKRC